MVTGLTGRTGATALSRVGEECRKEQGLVPIPHRHLEESRVLERVKKRERAMKTPAQVTHKFNCFPISADLGFVIHIYIPLVLSLVFNISNFCWLSNLFWLPFELF